MDPIQITKERLINPQGLNIYAYANNNPIIFIDPDGRFTMPIHQIITENAFNNSGVSKGWQGIFMNDVLAGVTYMADVAGFTSDLHFDGRQNYQEVQSTWDNLNSAIDAKIDDLGPINKTMGGPDAIAFGRLLHTVQDFYSHSNYVELYIEYYKESHKGEMPTMVPIYDEGLGDEKFKSILEQKLRTGDFNIADNEFTHPNGKEANKPTSHNKMNKDNADTPAGKLAKNAATRHSTKVLNKLK